MNEIAEKSYMQTNNNESTSINKYAMLGWVICALGALFYSYEYLLRIIPGVIEAELTQHYGINGLVFGTLSGIYYDIYAPMQLPVGVLLDRFGPRRLLSFACLVCVAGSYLFVATHSLFIAGLGRFLLGFGSAFAFVGVLKLATIWLPAERFGMFAGLAAALGTVGAMVGETGVTALVESMGWQQVVFGVSLAGIGLALVMWLVIRDKAPDNAISSEAELSGDDSIAPSNMQQAIAELFVILQKPQIWLNGLIGCLIYLPTTAFAELWAKSYLQVGHSMSAESAAFGVVLLFLGFTIGAPMAGFISDKLHNRRLPIIIGAGCASVTLATIIYMPGLTQTTVYTLMFLTGLLYGPQAIAFAIGRDLSPAQAAGTAVAVTNMIIMIGGIVLQPVIGLLLELSFRSRVADYVSIPTHIYSAQDYQFAMIVLPAGVALSAILAFFLKPSANPA